MDSPLSLSPVQHKKRQYTYIRRRKLAKVSSVLSHSISDIMSLQCTSNCLDDVPSAFILKIRSTYLSRNQTERNKWLSNWLDCNKIAIGNNQFMYRWHINGTEVCSQCWLAATGATKYKLLHCSRTIHGNKNMARVTDRLSSTLAWLKSYLLAVCDHMPTRNEYHLPCFLQWKDVHNELNTYLGSKGMKKYSQPQFHHLMKSHFPHVKLPKYTRLGKCDLCLMLKDRKSKATTEEERLQVQQEIILHNANQMNERIQYKQRCLKAGISLLTQNLTDVEQYPTDYLSIIIDGMNTVLFPVSIPTPKSSSRVERMKLHIHGIIDHGHNHRQFYGSLDHWSHGSDYIATLLLHYINTKVLLPVLSSFPHTLYIQADNCWKENKNITIFCTLGMFLLNG